MRELLQPESRFIRFLSRLCDLLFLNLALDFLCLTIVFSGTAVTSAYALTLKMTRDEEGDTVKSFIRGLRDNFTAATPATILLFVDVLLLAVIYYALNAEVLVLAPTFFLLLCASAVLLTALLSWLFPLLARFENDFSRHFRNAARLAISHLPATVLLTAVNLLPFLSIVFFPNEIGYLACFWLLIGVSAGAYLNSFILRKIFDAA